MARLKGELDLGTADDKKINPLDVNLEDVIVGRRAARGKKGIRLGRERKNTRENSRILDNDLDTVNGKRIKGTRAGRERKNARENSHILDNDLDTVNGKRIKGVKREEIVVEKTGDKTIEFPEACYFVTRIEPKKQDGPLIEKSFQKSETHRGKIDVIPKSFATRSIREKVKMSEVDEKGRLIAKTLEIGRVGERGEK